jgi:hypothetical protein
MDVLHMMIIGTVLLVLLSLLIRQQKLIRLQAKVVKNMHMKVVTVRNVRHMMTIVSNHLYDFAIAVADNL